MGKSAGFLPDFEVADIASLKDEESLYVNIMYSRLHGARAKIRSRRIHRDYHAISVIRQHRVGTV